MRFTSTSNFNQPHVYWASRYQGLRKHVKVREHSPPRRGGWRDSLIEAGAPGAKREPDRAKPQLVVSSAKSSAELTTPSAPPLLCEEGNRFGTFLLSGVLKVLFLTNAAFAFGAICFS